MRDEPNDFRRASRIDGIEISQIVQISETAAQMCADGHDVVSLSTGAPDFPTPDFVVAAAHDAAVAGQTGYTATAGTNALRDAIAAEYGAERAQVVVSTGAKQVLANAMLATLDEGDEVIIPTPYWTSYSDIVAMAGGKAVTVPCPMAQGFKLTPEALEGAITPKTRWVMLNSPSNPSGAIYTAQEIRDLATVLQAHPQVWVLADEIYEHFGHADVGCVHVRPALDMRKPQDRKMIRKVSDAVHALAEKHGGLIWGEHGKGFRGEYVPDVFGPRLYGVMCQIKAAFDPDNLLNPGKIASPDPAVPLTRLDAVPFRGVLDATISAPLAETYDDAVKCNGNGQCMGRDVDDAMCPSFKATGDRTRGPKGRATMLRAWARMQSQLHKPAELPELEEELFASLSDCLGCKACASQCPAKVDIPKMRSAFYEAYFTRHRRPFAHTLLAALEPLSPLLRRVRGLPILCCAPVRQFCVNLDWLICLKFAQLAQSPSSLGHAGK